MPTKKVGRRFLAKVPGAPCPAKTNQDQSVGVFESTTETLENEPCRLASRSSRLSGALYLASLVLLCAAFVELTAPAHPAHALGCIVGAFATATVAEAVRLS